MKPQLKSSPAARDLIKRFEPFHEVAARGPDGRWRVGFGHRAAARDGVRVSRDDASLLLIYDVMQAEAAVDEMFPAALPRLQRDALTSFVHDIGAAAFRTSDVARYLFEGRVDAAAEALAAYGDSNMERREAESAMLLSSIEDVPAPATTAPRPTMVDLVIKVEHADDTVAATPAAVAVRERPALPDSLMPPPPPPAMTQKAIARREAESEIARILATVGAMPLEDEPDLVEAAPAPEPEPVAEQMAMTEAEPETELDAVEAAAVTPAPAVEPQPELIEPANAGSEPETVEAPEPVATALEVIAAPQVASEASPPVSAQVIARMSQEIAHVQTAIVGRHERRELLPDDPDDLPEDVSLGYVFTGSMAASLEIAEDTPQDANTELGSDPIDAPDAAAAEAVEPAPEPAADEDVAAEAEADIEAEPEVAAEIEAGEDTPSEAEAEGDAEAATIMAAAGIVERTLAVAGDRNPPPHPADAPATSAGAIGEITREPAGLADESDASHPAHVDELTAVGNQSELDALAGEDAFSPSDLVGTADVFSESKPAEPARKEDGWGFVVALIAGLVVTGAGVMDIYTDWPRVWVDRDPTWGVLASAAGLFLVVTAAWFLWTIMAANRKQKTTR